MITNRSRSAIHPGFWMMQSICRAVTLLGSFLSPSLAWAAPTFASGASQGTVSISELTEASGLVASRNNAGVLWTHNDKGDAARIIALDTQGRKLGIYTLPGATHVDYEDIGLGPGPVSGVLYLYLGDIGDNDSNRANIRVYQIPEPAVYARQFSSPVATGLKGMRTITLTYPDGARDAEAMFVDPLTGDLFIATKASTSRIYTATKSQLDAGTNVTLSFVRTLGFDSPSAADISAGGTEILIRQEDFARLWTRSSGQSISAALAGTAITIPVIGTSTEPNGEAIGYDGTGSGYFTLSDDQGSQPLYYFNRTSADGPDAQQTLLGAGATWRYLDDGSNQNPAWKEAGFDDSTWSSGEGQFGYGDGDEKTVVGYGGDSNNKHRTTYFRTTFQLEDSACITSLELKLLFNDGAAVYVNGVQVVLANLPAKPAWNTLATATQTDLEDAWFTYAISPSFLVDGTNTIAAEVHQASANSPDLSFDLQLVGKLAAGVPTITTQPASQSVGTGGSASFSVVAAGDPPLSYQWRKNGNPITGATASTFTISNVQSADAGTFSVVVSNTKCATSSQNATLSVTNGTTLLNDSFSDGSFTNQSLPGSAKWHTSSSGGIAMSPASDALKVDPGRMALAFFKDSGVQSLAVGEKISASFTLVFSAVGNSTHGFRFGFFNSNGASRPPDSSDSAFSAYDGYIVTATAKYPASDGSTDGALIVRQRNPGAGGKLLGTIGSGYFSDVDESAPISQSFVAGVSYNAMFTIARTASNTVNLAVQVTGGSLANYGFSTEDITGIITGFDGFAVLSTSSNGSSYTIDNVNIVHSTGVVPSPLENWRFDHFESMENIGNAANNADADFDGMPNLIEYLFGLDPTQPDAGGAVITGKVQVAGADYLTITFKQDINATGITFAVLAGGDLFNLSAWDNIDPDGVNQVSSSTNGSIRTRTIRDNVPMGSAIRRFMRIVAAEP